jgi:hypothetical protein
LESLVCVLKPDKITRFDPDEINPIPYTLNLTKSRFCPPTHHSDRGISVRGGIHRSFGGGFFCIRHIPVHLQRGKLRVATLFSSFCLHLGFECGLRHSVLPCRGHGARIVGAIQWERRLDRGPQSPCVCQQDRGICGRLVRSVPDIGHRIEAIQPHIHGHRVPGPF